MEIERCVGCDVAAKAETGGHPAVAVMARDDAAARGYDVSGATTRGFVQVPVCRACHADPAHRVFPIKGHFFEKKYAASGVHRAGTNQVGRG
jgi:hypothetical protein